jgi:C1A family cysteine protease
MDTNNEYALDPWFRDPPDPRDHIFEQPDTIIFPKTVDLRPFCDVVYNQYKASSCVANALAAMLTYKELRKNKNAPMISRLFIYYNAREYLNLHTEDKGATIRGGIKTLAKFGAPEESEWRYDIFKVNAKPPPEVYEKALARRVIQYSSVRTLEDILYNLACDNPVVFGFDCPASFMEIGLGSINKTGIFTYAPNEPMVMGHAVLAIGYDLEKEHLIIRNSWSKVWGDNGYYYMPFSYITSGYCSDFWVIKT